MSVYSKILRGLQFSDGKGGVILAGMKAEAVIATDGTSAQQHFDDADKHLSQAERGYMTAAGAANGVALLDADGHLPSGVFDSTKMPVEISVADIAARDALTGLADGAKVLVEDATADTSVVAGWAIYRHRAAVGGTPAGWTKMAESESLDIVHDWASIQNRPVADADLTDAVTKRHAHLNTAVLDLLSATAEGKLQYNSADVGNTLLASKLVTEVPAVWPADVRTDGVLYLVEASA